VRRVHATTRFTTSVYTGSLLLAAAGLLDGLTAATHWGTAGEIEGYGHPALHRVRPAAPVRQRLDG
jgi:transcriptional regulator GlxA family with amidase domain